MNKIIRKTVPAYKVEIFIGGDLTVAKDICLNYCTKIGLCVTIEPTTFVYRNGSCEGVRIGLINYARFPSDETQIWDKAIVLANLLKDGLGQGSYTVQDHAFSFFLSDRDEDQ